MIIISIPKDQIGLRLGHIMNVSNVGPFSFSLYFLPLSHLEVKKAVCLREENQLESVVISNAVIDFLSTRFPCTFRSLDARSEALTTQLKTHDGLLPKWVLL